MEKRTLYVQDLVQNSEQSTPIVPTGQPGWRNSYNQIIAACVVHLLAVQVGVNMAFSSILIPQLNLPDSEIPLEPGEDTWIASLVPISLPFGSFISGPLMDKYGRRNIILFVCIPYLISWILIRWSYSVIWLYVARALSGAAGGVSSVAIFYTSETTNSSWRPMLLGLNSVFVSLGILLTGIFGWCFYWRTVAVIFAVFTIAIFFLVLILPESPHWLLSFGNGTQDLNRVSKARKSIKWLNRNNSQADRELDQLLTAYRTDGTKNETLKRKLESFATPEIYKPVILLLIIFLFQQSTGSFVVIFYAVELFQELGGNFGVLDEYGAMVAMGLLRFVMAIVAMLLSQKFGRRILSIVSGIGMGISMLLVWSLIEFTRSENKVLVIALVMLFVCSAAIGWQTIPWALSGELLPTKMRANVGGIIFGYANLLMFVTVKTFPALILAVRVKGVFLIYGIISFASSLFVWKYLPETFGKTLTEIERYFK